MWKQSERINNVVSYYNSFKNNYKNPNFEGNGNQNGGTGKTFIFNLKNNGY